MTGRRRPAAAFATLTFLATAPALAQSALTVDRLANFRTRNTLSSATNPSAGIGAARQWILNEMKGVSLRLDVRFGRHVVPPGGRITREVELVNVMAMLPGRSRRRVYVRGHYDTVVLRPAPEDSAAFRTNDNYAPGANDDGSGTALTMELARVFAQSGLEFDATLVFIALAGEEQGDADRRSGRAPPSRDCPHYARPACS